MFHRVFPDYFATSALFQCPGPPIRRLQTTKVPVRSSLPLRRRASAHQHLKCSALPPSQPYHRLLSCPRRQPCLLPLSHHVHPPLSVQRAFRHLPSPSFAAANTPSSSSVAYIQPSSSLSQAPSSLGESLHFPSFVSTVCLATGTPSSPFVSTGSRRSLQTIRSPPPQSLLQCRPYHPPRSPQVRPLPWCHCRLVRRLLAPGAQVLTLVPVVPDPAQAG